jgi:hypothetical protein
MGTATAFHNTGGNMTRKHFEAIARTVRQTAKDYDERTRFALAFADLCAEYNSAFDRVRFLRACQLAGETIREVA